MFAAYRLHDKIFNLDMLSIARTTKLSAEPTVKAENETMDAQPKSPRPMDTEFHGGEGNEQEDPVEEDEHGEQNASRHVFNVDVLNQILTREGEITAASKKGRKKDADKQMKLFDDRFHALLHTAVCPNSVNLHDVQLAYTHPQALSAALQVQDQILKQMRSDQPDVKNTTDGGDAPDFAQRALLHNLRQKDETREWIPLDAALQGPAHVAKLLIRRCQEKRSKPNKPYKLNAEQLECIALYVEKLEEGFARRPDPSQPWVNPAEVLMTIILDGGGGCGKTTLAVDVLLPLQETFFGVNGVLRRSPSNKPARLIGGRTMHSAQGLTPDSSMRTHNLALNAQSRQKLAITNADAGAMHLDEYSQLQGELNNAAALRTTYAREGKYNLDRNKYHAPQERYGRLAMLTFGGDHLQLPPVPASSSVLAPLEHTSDEHKVGARIFRNAELVFQFETAMRFEDQTQIAILETMRTPGGKCLTREQWRALEETELTAEQPDVPAGWYHTCYCWSITSMASFLVARQSANRANQTLFYVQAVDAPIALTPDTITKDYFKQLLQVPNISQTKKLPGVVLFHLNMRVRFTTTIQQPFAVQDVEATVVGFDPDPNDHGLKARLQATSSQTAEWPCALMPHAIYVKIDECDYQFLPPGTCSLHRQHGHDDQCEACLSAVQPGVFAVKPLVRTWKNIYWMALGSTCLSGGNSSR